MGSMHEYTAVYQVEVEAEGGGNFNKENEKGERTQDTISSAERDWLCLTSSWLLVPFVVRLGAHPPCICLLTACEHS